MLLASIVLNWRVRVPASVPALEFAPNMARSVRSNAFERNASFGDGATLQSPVPGTIPRGVVPLHYSPSRPEARRAGEELINPYSPGDRAALARGASVYRDFCVPCHAGDGKGEGPVVARGYPRPPSLLRPQARQMKDGEIFHIITYGRGIMPAHASQVSRDDRWKAIAHVRALQVVRPGPGQAAP
ncbi:MAG: cytochrome c [Acidobacteria bacterium]|nr:cytochrome c [Acidobacteriota bacterium]